MSKHAIEQFVDQIATTLATSTRDFIERRLDERLQQERLHMREIVKAEFEARGLPPSAAAAGDERRLQ